MRVDVGKTRAVKIAIDERRKPHPEARPGREAAGRWQDGEWLLMADSSQIQKFSQRDY